MLKLFSFAPIPIQPFTLFFQFMPLKFLFDLSSENIIFSAVLTPIIDSATMFSSARNAKRSAEDAAPTEHTKQTVAQSLANLGGEDAANLMDTEVTENPAGSAVAAATPMKKSKTSMTSSFEGEKETTETTRAAAAAEEQEDTFAIKEQDTTAFPESTTPRRVAGANVLASLGGSGTSTAVAAGQSMLEGIPTLPPIVEVATAEGMAAQHDYLLQNLVHVSKYVNLSD